MYLSTYILILINLFKFKLDLFIAICILICSYG
jgi:hypothetical protein